MSLITSCQKRIASKLARRLRGSSRSANTASALVQPSSVLPGFHKPVRCGRRDQRLAVPHARAYARRGESPGHQTPIPSEAVRQFRFPDRSAELAAESALSTIRMDDGTKSRSSWRGLEFDRAESQGIPLSNSGEGRHRAADSEIYTLSLHDAL